MPARYSVVQYVPDPIADERINIGVVAFTDERVAPRFLNDWSRVRKFTTTQDVTFLREFARTFAGAASPELLIQGFEQGRPLDAGFIESAASDWINSIQFTTPRASLHAVEDVLAEMCARFLAEPVRHRHGARDRRQAANVAVRYIRLALDTQIGENAEELVRRRQFVQGNLQRHRFDAVVANGVPYFAAQALSFEVPESPAIHKDIDATAWQLSDVKALDKALPLAVIALPPREGSEQADRMRPVFEKAREVFQHLGAEVVTEDHVEMWADRMASRIPIAG